MNTNWLLSIAILAITIDLNILSNNAKSELTIIHPFCKAAENKSLCTRIVDGATTRQAAASKAIVRTLEIAKQGKPMIDDLVKSLSGIRLSRMGKESIEHTCNEIYDFAIDCLEGALVDLRYGNKERLKTKLSAVTGPASECTNSVKKLGIDSRLFEFFTTLGLYSRQCLSIATTV